MVHSEAVLVVIKPDGMEKKLIGPIFTKLFETQLELMAIRLLQVSRQLAEEHYRHIKGRPFYERTIRHLMGEFHQHKNVLAMVYCGPGAVKKCRQVAGATNPHEADPASIRGRFGRVTSDGIFENVIHVSSDTKEAEREIKLWFEPDDILMPFYRTKTIALNAIQKHQWDQ